MRIFGEVKESDKITYLKLVPSQDSAGIDLVATDEKGEVVFGGYLLAITEGEIIRYDSVNRTLGFKLGESDRVKFSN